MESAIRQKVWNRGLHILCCSFCFGLPFWIAEEDLARELEIRQDLTTD